MIRSMSLLLSHLINCGGSFTLNNHPCNQTLCLLCYCVLKYKRQKLYPKCWWFWIKNVCLKYQPSITDNNYLYFVLVYQIWSLVYLILRWISRSCTFYVCSTTTYLSFSIAITLKAKYLLGSFKFNKNTGLPHKRLLTNLDGKGQHCITKRTYLKL